MNYKLTIGWLYPDLMSTYGDRGNIIVLQKRCEWRNIQLKVFRLDFGFRISDLKTCDMLFMGGAQDKQQQIVANDLIEKKGVLKRMIEEGVPGLYICGAYQFLGEYYKEANGTIIPGLEILDLYTENPSENSQRLTGNIIVELNIRNTKYQIPNTLVGFENHGGRTYLGSALQALGTVRAGYGNNGTDRTEGVIYKNSFGTYFHGPILPKNPHFADHLIKLSLEKKYSKEILLSPLEDKEEWLAHKFIVKKLGLDI